MLKNFIITSIFFTLLFGILNGQSAIKFIQGKVVDYNTHQGIHGAIINDSNKYFLGSTDKSGNFQIQLKTENNLSLIFSHLSYNKSYRTIACNKLDTFKLEIYLTPKFNSLDTIAVFSSHKPETLIGKPNYSVFDFEFYQDKLILLTTQKSLVNAEVRLADFNGNISSVFIIPTAAGKAVKLCKDYERRVELICEDTIFRLGIWNNELVVKTVRQNDYKKYIRPISDTASGKYYANNQWEKYPSFDYYTLQANAAEASPLLKITNHHLMKLYNKEYYFLPPRMQLEARRVAQYYKTDAHIVAALMSGFTQSQFYEALYAPLFIINDTVCVFNHYVDALFRYNLNNQLIDSVPIFYHHPKNWREWKKQLLVDEEDEKIYALFSKNGHVYLKLINHASGEIMKEYKLKHHGADKVKIKGGYVYYVYRPFNSTQEKFLYRERIE
jgi:hypothetical protein